MIGAIAILASALATADPDTSSWDLLVGIEGTKKFTGLARSWIGPEVQVDAPYGLFVRGSWAGEGAALGEETYGLEPDREVFAVCAGKEWRGRRVWAGIGAGWTWIRWDTVTSYVDPRPVYGPTTDWFYGDTTYSYSAGPARWHWLEAMREDSPYFVGECGVRLGTRLGIGGRVEFRRVLSVAVGFRYQLI